MLMQIENGESKDKNNIETPESIIEENIKMKEQLYLSKQIPWKVDIMSNI